MKLFKNESLGLLVVAIDIAHAADMVNDYFERCGAQRIARADDFCAVDMNKPSILTYGGVL